MNTARIPLSKAFHQPKNSDSSFSVVAVAYIYYICFFVSILQYHIGGVLGQTLDNLILFALGNGSTVDKFG